MACRALVALQLLLLVAFVGTVRGEGFSWGDGCGPGKGDFSKQVEEGGLLDVGTIPKGKFGVQINLFSDADVDVQLFDLDDKTLFTEGKALIAYCDPATANCNGCKDGDASCLGGVAGKGSITHEGMIITYSGYAGQVDESGEQPNPGNEWIRIEGESSRNMAMKAFGFNAGTATIRYSWTRKQTGCCLATEACTGSFDTTVAEGKTASVGEIPKGKKNLQVKLEADVDVDVQLFDIDQTDKFPEGKAIIAWCGDDGCNGGVLGFDENGAAEEGTYKGLNYKYSGYNGVDGKAGHEYISIDGVTNVRTFMKAYGYAAGPAKVSYSYYEVIPPEETLGGVPPGGVRVAVESSTVPEPGKEVVFKATAATGEGIEWAWDYGSRYDEAADGAQENTSATGRRTFSEAGDYTVTVTATNEFGTQQAQVTVSVDLPIAGLAIVKATGNVYEPHTPLGFNATVSQGTRVQYLWNYGHTYYGQDTRAQARHTYPDAGNFVVKVQAKNSRGSIVAQADVAIAEPPLAKENLKIFAVSPNEPGWPVILAAEYTAYAGRNIEYTWDFQGELDPKCLVQGATNAPCKGRVLEHTWKEPGEYTVTLTAANSKNHVVENFQVTIKPFDSPVAERREIRAHTTEQWNTFKRGVLELKRNGVYDHLVAAHLQAAQFGMVGTDTGRNAAHRGPSFLAWHRVFLRIYERTLQQAHGDLTLGIPYWDWRLDMDLPDPKQSPIWTEKFMGPTGDPDNNYAVPSGPFCSIPSSTCDGKFPIADFLQTPNRGVALMRDVGGSGSLSNREQIAAMMEIEHYDQHPYDSGSRGAYSFRNALEGWAGGAYGRGHNAGHVFIGGSMMPFTSPNDPMFFANHAMTDKVWYDWQVKQNAYATAYHPQDKEASTGHFRVNKMSAGMTMVNREPKLVGHHWSDALFPWSLRPRDVADQHNSLIGYKWVD